jgi:uncharacterized protein YceH (UPF0502 family)
MPLDLDPLEQRIVGTLIEKQMSVPETYPLTVNSLVAGCNQKSNRDPEMAVDEHQVTGALRALMEKGWVIEMEREGGRTRRYAHQAGTQLGVEPPDLAVLSELLNRGPQTPMELRTRASRMSPFQSPEDVERRLGLLASRPVPYVKLLERRPREREARWAHLLGSRPSTEAAVSAPPPRAVPPAAPPVAVRPTPAAPPPSPAALPSDLALRIEELESRVEELANRLDRLEGR